MGFLDIKDEIVSKLSGPNNIELYQSTGKSVKQYLSGKSGDVRFALDSLMFQFPSLDIADSFGLFDYEFVIHNGKKVLARLVLPMPPQSVNINVPTAVQTTVTMRGITEEHNAAPLRQISLAGTFGVYPSLPNSASSAAGSKGPLDYLFANTIQAVNRVADRAEKLLNAFSDNSGPLSTALIDQPSEWVQTSYTVAHNMDRFFSAYLEAKKGGTVQLYLGLNMHKDKMYYDCTLNNYAIRKQAGSMEYLYQIALTAWRRRETPVENSGSQRTLPSVNSQQEPNYFARISGALNDARELIGESLFILKGIQGDIQQNILNPLKQINLLVKDALGAKAVYTDFSAQITRDYKQVMVKGWAQNIKAKGNPVNQEQVDRDLAIKGLFDPVSPSPISSAVVADENDTDYSKRVVDEQVKAQAEQVKQQTQVLETLKSMRSTDTVSIQSAQAKLDAELKRLSELSQTNTSESSSPVEQIFDNPEEFLDALSMVPIDELELPAALQLAIDAEINAARKLSYQDIANTRAQLVQFTSLLSQRLGGQDAVYNQVFGISDIDIDKKLSTDDMNFLIKLDDAAGALDDLIVLLRDGAKTNENDYAKFYGDYARTQGIDFEENSSKFYVPFPFGASLESLAVQYLGSANRWIEIAAINGLKEPYIDEIGSFRSFSGSGSGNSFFVESSDSIYIGQILQFSSDTQTPENRRVEAFDIISEVQTIITVSGEADLAKFKIADNAKIRVFAPNTVNSRMLIAIPTTTPVNVPGNIQINPSERDLTNIGYVAKSDFLLINYEDGTSDIGFIGSDVAIAQGVTNLIQAANIKLKTLRGELVNDPDFGNPLEAGDSLADFDAGLAVSRLSALFAEDSRFNRVAAARIQVQGRAATLDLLLDVVKSQAFLPLTTTIPWI